MIDLGSRKEGMLVSFTSADGIRFGDETVMTDVGAFDTLNIVLWDDTAKRYRGYVRSFHDIPMVGGSDYMDFVKAQKNGSVRVIPGMDTDEVHKEGAGVLNLGKRDIRYMESKDFVSWSEPKRLSFGESEDIPLYTSGVSQYEFAPHMFIGFQMNEQEAWRMKYDENTRSNP